MNAQHVTAPTVTEKYPHKVVFKPQGVLAFVHSILPHGGILRFTKNGSHACACFDNLIDFNDFRTKLSHVTIV